jgi:hypothetical protein
LPHLTQWDRQKRLEAGLEVALKRVEDCLSDTSDSKAIAELQSLKTEAISAIKSWKTKASSDTDTVKTGVDLIFRMEQTASGACGNPSDRDQAWLLIGQQHNGERP